MKKTIYFTIIACLLASCVDDDFYSEGRIKTISATEVTNQSAVLNGSIQVVTEGKKASLNIQSRGFKYGTSSNNLNQTVSDMVSGEGNFSCNVDDLLPNTKYYVRAFAVVATNNGKSDDLYALYVPPTYYGNTIEFTTEDGEIPPPPPTPPVVTTLAATNVSLTTATLNGRIDEAGEPAFIERGFVYSASFQNPTIEDDDATTKRVVSGTSTEFSANISGLTTEQTYYTRAYATNSNGTVYGASLSFKPTAIVDYVELTAAGIAVQKTDISNSTINWSSANNLCNNSIVGGYTNWRLPTISELGTLYTNRTTIGGFTTGWYWSSSVGTNGNSYHQSCDFSTGTVYANDANSASNRARCVRSLP